MTKIKPEKKPDSGKKHSEQDAAKTPSDPKVEKKVSDLEKEAKLNLTRPEIFVPVATVLVVLLAYLVQFGYDIYVSQPGLERSLLSVHDSGLGNQKNFGIYDANSILSFRKTENKSRIISLKIVDEEKERTLISELSSKSWIRYSTGNGQTFGQVDLFESNLTISIQYITGKGGVMFHIQSAAAHATPQASALIRIVDSPIDSESTSKDYNISHGSELAITVSTFGQEDTKANDFANRFSKLSDEFDQKFEDVFGLKEKNMVGFYSNMAKSALSTVLHSTHYQSNAVVKGKVIKKFITNTETARFTRRHTSFGSFEDQIFPLLVIQKFAPDQVVTTLTTWLNTINGHRRIINEINDRGQFLLTDINQPLLFLLIKNLERNNVFDTFLKNEYEKLDVYATELLSSKKGDYLDLSGIVQKEPTLDHAVLLQNAVEVMLSLCTKLAKDCSKYNKFGNSVKPVLDKHWDNGFHNLDDEGRKVPTPNPYAPVLLKLLKPQDERLLTVLQQLEKDQKLTRFGLSDGASSALTTNYLLLDALRYYAEHSGPAQGIAHQIFSQLKNNIISMVARAFKDSNTFHERYSSEGKPVGQSSTFGCLIILITSDSY